MPSFFDRCPFCKSADIRRVWPQTGYDYCHACGLYFRNPMPTEEELTKLYANSWSAPETKRAETGGTDDRLASIYAQKLARSLGRTDLSDLRILDFGAGRGAVLEGLTRLGAKVSAVEPFGYEYLRSRGYQVYGSLADVETCFDGIIMIDVLEHLAIPWQVLANLREKLIKEGWIYVATGNPLGLNARLRKGQWREARKRGHLLFPSPTTMERMFSYCGFKRFQRLKWYIQFHPFPRSLVDYVLQALRLDGELRYLAWR